MSLLPALSIVVAAWLVGRGVAAGVGRLLVMIEQEAGEGGSGSVARARRFGRPFEIASVVFGAGVVLWEVVAGGLGPPPQFVAGDAITIAGWGGEVARCLAHVVLFGFLAAATWCDLEHRVIPDAITLPGTLLGFASVMAMPGLLPPVACELERSFAPPVSTPDVLGAIGPLVCSADAATLGPMPSALGLVAAVAAFGLWWVVCTAPGHRPPRIDPRTWLLPAGLAVVVAAWWIGGTAPAARLHYRGLEAALAGAVVSGGLVWATRAGASFALGREAMGLGDVTLMAMVGSWCGWQLGVLAFFVATFLGLGQGLVTWLRHRDNELPFGPSLCVASGLLVLAWSAAWRIAGPYFEEPLLVFGVIAAVVALTGLSLGLLAAFRRRAG